MSLESGLRRGLNYTILGAVLVLVLALIGAIPKNLWWMAAPVVAGFASAFLAGYVFSRVG